MSIEVEQVLKISPTTLNFPPPLERAITNILKLTNTSRIADVAYKVKTTAPKRYCVRPNLGRISPGETIEVQVLLNFYKDPPKDLNCKDRFQVQSIILDGSAPHDLKQLFNSTDSNKIQKQRLKCRFAAPAPAKPRQSVRLVEPAETTSTPTKSSAIESKPVEEELTSQLRQRKPVASTSLAKPAGLEGSSAMATKSEGQEKKDSNVPSVSTPASSNTVSSVGKRSAQGQTRISSLDKPTPSLFTWRHILHLILVAIIFYYLGAYFG